jgi:predicted nucleic acid-binding protein
VPLSAVLDANVLYPFALRDTLLRLGQAGLYRPVWSTRILEEVRRNLVEERVTADQADRMLELMRAAFAEAEVSEAAVRAIEPAMTNAPEDRHVLAAAVVSGAEVIVTLNTRDFPASACAVVGVEAVHPDDFLMALHELAPVVVRGCLERQAADLRRPPKTLAELLEMLERTVPTFAGVLSGHG